MDRHDEEALNSRERFLSRIVDTPNGCTEWQGCVDLSNGYGRLRCGGKYGWNVLVHKLSWFFEKGVWPTKFVCHECDNKICVKFEHFFEGTSKQNTQDAAQKGLLLKKISFPQQQEIIELIQEGRMSYSKIGSLYGVTGPSIRNIAVKFNITRSRPFMNELQTKINPIFTL